MSDLEEFLQTQPAHRRSVYLHLGAMALLICISVTSLFSTDNAFAFERWLGLASAIVGLMLGKRANYMIKERREELRRLIDKAGSV